QREEARASRRLVPLQRSILFTLYCWHTWQRRGQHRHKSPWFSMCPIARECRATKNAELGLNKRGTLIEAHARQELQLPERSSILGPTNAGFVLPFQAMPAAQRSDSVFSSKQIYLSTSWVMK